jgi:CubicO group peptidase (beta-lactamase class C family)
MPEPAPFPRSAPEAQGIRSRAILAFIDAVERDIHDLNSFLLLRRGAAVAEGYWEPYGVGDPHMLFSLSKSFTSTAIGLLVAAGRLSVEDRVLDFFPEDAPAQPSEHLQAMRVKHLLTMTTGHDPDPTRLVRQSGEQSWTRAFLAEPLPFAPGTHFVYNSLATYMLSAIAQRLTDEPIVQFLQPRLFTPLGIEPPTWETSPQGINTGGWGLSLRTRDIARFGQLYLQRGEWQGVRLLPESWVAAATSRQVPNGPSPNPDWVQGYGYQFWQCRHGAYRGDGAHGQFCVVLPQHETVVAITSGTRDLQGVLDRVWEHLLPALEREPLPADPAAAAALGQRLAGLRLPPTAGRADAPAVAASGRPYALEPNPTGLERLGFEFSSDGATLRFSGAGGEQTLPCGYGRWVRSEGNLLRRLGGAPGIGGTGFASPKVAATGAWTDDQTYSVDICWYETPFRRRLVCHFDGDRVRVDQEPDELASAMGPAPKLPSLIGQYA